MPRIPPKGRPFVKGQSGNPHGGQLHNPELKAVRKLSQEIVAEVGELIISGDIYKLRLIAEDKTQCSLNGVMAKVWLKAYDKGDTQAMDAILDRIVGKVPQKTQLSGEVGIRGRFSNMSDADLQAEAAAQAERLKALENG